MSGNTGPSPQDGTDDSPTTVLSAPGDDTEVLPGAPTPAAPTVRMPAASPGPAAGPGAVTQVVADAGTTWGRPWEPGEPGAPPAPLVGRREAAEIGMYVGALLVLIALGSAVVRGWAAWDGPLRWSTAALSAVALVAAGTFARLGWGRNPSGQRRRAVSALLTCGTAIALSDLAVAVGPDQGGGGAAGAVLVAVALGSALACAAAAHTPLSETGLLAALAWSVWLLVPAGPALWAGLVGLGATWVVVGTRWARGRRTAGMAGSVLALAAGVALASGPWAWPARAGLAVVMALGLVRFFRGGANHWLALGAAAATALAAAVAGDVLGPALALLVGGVATTGVSALALRSTPARH